LSFGKPLARSSSIICSIKFSDRSSVNIACLNKTAKVIK
jgi:hypothetical protein